MSLPTKTQRVVGWSRSKGKWHLATSVLKIEVGIWKHVSEKKWLANITWKKGKKTNSCNLITKKNDIEAILLDVYCFVNSQVYKKEMRDNYQRDDEEETVGYRVDDEQPLPDSRQE